MPFDPLAWATGVIITAISKSIFKSIFTDSLPANLRKAVSLWAKDISTEIQIDLLEFFSKVPKAISSEDFPKLDKLREEFKKSHIPKREIWFDALYESWLYVKSSMTAENLQDFFKIDSKLARQYLLKLAEKLELTCKKDSDLLHTTQFDMQDEMLSRLKNIESKFELSQTAPISVEDPLFTASRNALVKLGKDLSLEKDEKLETYRELYRQGSTKEAYNNILELNTSDSFNYLTNTVKAKILHSHPISSKNKYKPLEFTV